jgi:hypothetical protein
VQTRLLEVDESIANQYNQGFTGFFLKIPEALINTKNFVFPILDQYSRSVNPGLLGGTRLKKLGLSHFQRFGGMSTLRRHVHD